jgi:hypothetical protein
MQKNLIKIDQSEIVQLEINVEDLFEDFLLLSIYFVREPDQEFDMELSKLRRGIPNRHAFSHDDFGVVGLGDCVLLDQDFVTVEVLDVLLETQKCLFK